MKFNIFLVSSPKAMADRKKRGKDENRKIRISRERKELKKTFSIVFEGLSFGEK